MTDTSKLSVALSDIPLALLIQRNQTLGRAIDEMRAERAHLNAHIAARIAAGEKEHPDEPAAPAGGDAVAPGAVIEAGLSS